MKFILRLFQHFIFLWCLFGGGANGLAQNLTSYFAKKIYVAPQGDTCRYRVMSPQTMQPNQKYPLVLFFHGAGERGKDNSRQLEVGVHQFATAINRQKYPCFVIAPQCPMKTRWVDTDFKGVADTMDKEPTRAFGIAMEMTLDFIKTHPIDTNRVYVIGISMGGFASWEAMARFPNLFAAAVPVSGGGDEKQAPKIKHIPTWAFHGGKDQIVLTSRSQNMIQALKAQGAQPRYTEYPGINHNCWAQTFTDRLLYAWMFEQRKK